MAGLRFLLAVAFGLLGTAAAASVNLTQENIDSSCNNKCFFNNMNGSCANDPACVCDQQKYRENYFCCMAKDCPPTTLPEALSLLHTDCSARNMDFNFDVEEACGITLSTSSTTTSKATSTASTSKSDTTSTTDASATASTASSAAKSGATSTGTTSETTSSGSTPSSTSNAASVRRISVEALVAPIAVFAML